MKSKSAYVFIFLEIFNCEGGIQSYVKDVLQAYATSTAQLENSTTAEVFLLRDQPSCDNPFDVYPFKFHYLKSRLPMLGRLKLVIGLLLSLGRQPSHVFCGHIKLAPLTRLLCGWLGVPYTVLTYGKEVWNWLPDKERQALIAASGIWTISRYSRDRLCTTQGINLDKVQLLPCVVDGTAFSPGKKSPELITKYQLVDAKVLLTVARLWQTDIYKGVDVTIRALPQIAAAFPEVKYLVIGRGDDQPRLQQLAQDLGVGDRVIFAGFIPTQNLVEHYRLADAYIMPSQEGFGIAYLEALACGKPVLSGDADGSSDPLQDGKLGWQVPHQDINAVAAACLEILQASCTLQTDRRCEAQWLRSQTLAQFGKDTLSQKLQQLLKAISP
jgi:phosphatidylinositol alpha-1,6-mannosyltransferase